MSSTDKFFTHVDSHQKEFIDRLAEAVAIPSVSGDPKHRPDVFKMADWLEGQLKNLGVETKKVPLGEHVMGDVKLELPPVILGTLGNDPEKKTILIYGHFDVQPASKSDGWNTDPFVLTPDNEGRLFGRGSTDDKGPVIGWLNVIESHQKTGTDLPVNLKMCFEGMEESGSIGLDELIRKEAKEYFRGVDAVCISDNYWLNTTTPCLTYGTRGNVYFQISISGPRADLHSGVFGGTVHEPMTDLTLLLSKLVTTDGKIMIPGINELVDPLTEEEKKRYEKISFDLSAFASQSVGAPITVSDDKDVVLMNRMRHPSLSIHGIEGAFYGAGSKTVIPATVHGKFSIRLVPNLTSDSTAQLAIKYINDEFAKLGSKNKCKVELMKKGDCWMTDPNHWNYVAAARATETVYSQKPDLTREGGSIPIILTLEQALEKNVLLLPMGRGDDGAHSTNEKLDTSNYIQGTKLLGAYLHEVAK